MATATTTPVTKPTLTYGTFAGLAETARVLLEDAGVDYAYVTVPNFADAKAQYQAAGKAPWGQFPFYEEPSGLVVAQSSAIARHLARQHGYYGANSDQAALIDQAAEGVIDIRTRFIQDAFRTTDEEAKAKAKTQFLAEYLPSQLEVFTKLLEKNGSNGYLVGSKVSYADVLLWTTVRLLFAIWADSKEVVAKYPAVEAFLDGIGARDRIKAYLARDVYATKN